MERISCRILVRAQYGRHSCLPWSAVIERLILTLKQSLRFTPLLSLRRERFRGEMAATIDWYNAARPHTTLNGATPDEIYFRRFPACRRPRLEPRSHWPRGSPCAKPHALVRGKPGAKLEVQVTFPAGRRHLPVVSIGRAA